MNCDNIIGQIIVWLRNKAKESNKDGFVVGVSGGIDSALVSFLCAMTGMKTLLIQMPIKRKLGPISERAQKHCDWLVKNWPWCAAFTRDLSETFDSFVMTHPDIGELSMANVRSRLRMISLYSFANNSNLLVAGTGNKVEDFGCGFFTKYGDGGVDISPIGDLMKSEVRKLSEHVGISQDIIDAVPTDELWDDTRSDEDQLGASYDELEWAMNYYEQRLHDNGRQFLGSKTCLVPRETDVLDIYIKRHEANRHKMEMPPICKLNKE